MPRGLNLAKISVMPFVASTIDRLNLSCAFLTNSCAPANSLNSEVKTFILICKAWKLEVVDIVCLANNVKPIPAIAVLNPPKLLCNWLVCFCTPLNALCALLASTISFTLACATN